MKKRFDCDDIGELKEYVGCKIYHDREKRTLKITQPVLLQSLRDEFVLPDGEPPITPAIERTVLMRGKPEDHVSPDDQSVYRTGVGKLLYLMKWSRVEMLNSIRELSRFMSGATEAHMAAMHRAMKYCLGTPKRGLLLKPNATWNGKPDFEFEIQGYSDSDYAKDLETRRSISGYAVFMNGAPVSMKSKMQSCVTLSVTEAELVSSTNCAQDMLFVMRLLESMGLKVKKPMSLYMDNKGAKDLTHNWSVGGRTRHVDVRQYFLRELKEEGTIVTHWVSGHDNPVDLYTKNLGGPDFERHAARFCGNNEYGNATPKGRVLEGSFG